MYVGSFIVYNGSIDPKLRIGKVSGAFNSLNKICYNKNISLKPKIRIYESSVLTILLYAAETWETNKLQIHRLEVFYQSSLRRILRVKLFNHMRNSETSQRKNQSEIRLLAAIRRLRWFGHVTAVLAGNDTFLTENIT